MKLFNIKKVIIFFVVPIAVIMSVIVYLRISNEKSVSDSNKTTVAFCPTGTYSETYYFEINTKENTLNAFFGTRNSDNIKSRHFLSSMSDKVHKTVNLEPKATGQMIHLLEEIENNKNLPEYCYSTDSWDILIYYNNHSYKLNYYTDNDTVKKLINLIIDISPIDVDLHGFA